ncbi:MAG: hypothetical protein ACP5R6_07520 [Chlorobaculum sp.]
MSPQKKQSAAREIQSVVIDGNLELAEALAALNAAAQAATAALPDALMKCETDEEMQTVIIQRDTCLLAYLSCMKKTLAHTGPYFESLAKDLEATSKKVKADAASLQTAHDAVTLLTKLTSLVGSLVLAFV